MAYVQESLGFDFGALEPHIDAATMETHFSKHHVAYIKNFNDAVAGTEFDEMSAEEVLRNLNKVPLTIRDIVRDHGGGAVNHGFFWKILTPNFKEIGGKIKEAIEEKFGSFEKFKEEFSAAAVGVFGSGWAWLVDGKDGLEIIKTKNQDSPLSIGKRPLLGIDVWEHAYYLKYKNMRAKYVEAFFEVVDWEAVEGNFVR